MGSEGFTTKGKDTSKVTYMERDDVSDWVSDFADEMGWNLSDVRNRAIMWYALKYRKGELDDPAVKKAKVERLEL